MHITEYHRWRAYINIALLFSVVGNVAERKTGKQEDRTGRPVQKNKDPGRCQGNTVPADDGKETKERNRAEA